MYFSKLSPVYNTELFSECKCEICGQPAVKMEADCHGDGIRYCQQHWIEWFDEELLPMFEKDINDPSRCGTYVKVNDEKIQEQFPGIGQLYEYKLKKDN